ncbi:PRC-barrel domain-containing protein [Plastorhodobacter daqingensis]|uniref:PRC-barrel domain-containing protein n=2 Tax=Plastorhodobacter daqingensis TaxID=1387281 RepID=A0ABW2UPE5_9RHOB
MKKLFLTTATAALIALPAVAQDTTTTPDTGVGTGVDTGVGTGVDTGVGTGAGTGVDTGVGTGAGTGVDTGVGTDTGTGAGTGLDTGTGVGTDTGTGTGVDTGVGTGTGVDTGTGTDMNTGPGMGTDTGVDPNVEMDFDTEGAEGSVQLADVDPQDLEGATVRGSNGDEIGTVSEVLTFDEGEEMIRAIVVDLDGRQVELDSLSFDVVEGENGDDYAIELSIEQDTLDAMPDYEGDTDA